MHNVSAAFTMTSLGCRDHRAKTGHTDGLQPRRQYIDIPETPGRVEGLLQAHEGGGGRVRWSCTQRYTAYTTEVIRKP
jgi:hypothetical protein